MLRAVPLIALIATLMLPAMPAPAQQGGPFAPRLFVNDRAITNYEFDQRVRMLTLFRAPGDIDQEAQRGLIDDRLRIAAATEIGLAARPEAVRAGMEEFAGRANLTAEQFLAALAQGGVSEESFRDFVLAGLLWREVVRTRFGDQVTITEAEIDRAIAATTQVTEVRFLLSELVIPAAPGREAEVLALAERLKSGIRSEGAFAQSARANSRSETAEGGGRLDWKAAPDLPPEVVAALAGLTPGQVTDPVQIGGAVVLFLLRGIDEAATDSPAAIAVDYARYILRPDRPAAEEAARVRAAVDTCDDLYQVALGEPPERLLRETASTGALPADLAAQLARLDAGEGVLITRGGQSQYLMLCSRGPVPPPSREVIANNLRNARLVGLSEIYLENLRADAILRTP